MSALIYCFIRERQRCKIKRWRKALKLNKHAAVFNQMYATEDGFALSRQARPQESWEYTYGEIEFESFIALLSLSKPLKSTIFYDLGSGIGKAILACSMVFEVQKSCGIEIFPLLSKTAQRLSQQLALTPGYEKKAAAIECLDGDFVERDFSDASLIFINSTAFIGETWNTMSNCIENQVKPGTVVISISKPLKAFQFSLLKKTIVKMSWGLAQAFIQQKY